MTTKMTTMDCRTNTITRTVLSMTTGWKIVCAPIEPVESIVVPLITLVFLISANPHDDPDQDWKPHRKAHSSHNDDDDGSSTDESEFELLREEAADFVENSSMHHSRPAKKKAKLNLHDPEE